MTARSARIGFAVNAPGIQKRRAHALAGALGECVADVMIAPTPAEVLRRARRWDVAYVIDPGRVGFPAAVAAKLAGATVLVEMGDPQRALYEAQDRSAPEQRLGALLDGLVSVGADGVVVRGRELARILRLRTRWTYVPDGVDLRHFRRLDASVLRDQLGIPSSALVCGVVGSITWSDRARFTYGLDLVEAIARGEASSAHALVVGDGTGLEMLRRRAAELGVVGRLHLVGRVAHELVPEYLNAMDVCVATQTRDDVGRSRTTAKLPEYLACDRWVLASRVGGAAELLPDSMLMESELVDWPPCVAEMAARGTGRRAAARGQAECADPGDTRTGVRLRDARPAGGRVRSPMPGRGEREAARHITNMRCEWALMQAAGRTARLRPAPHVRVDADCHGAHTCAGTPA